MKVYDVECRVHGKYELVLHPDTDVKLCQIRINGKPCNEPLKRLYPVPNVHYKGTGFYKTDNGG